MPAQRAAAQLAAAGDRELFANVLAGGVLRVAVGDQGAARLIDFMPPRGKYRDVVRIVEGIRGRVEMEMILVVRFDYGLTLPWVKRSPEGLTAVAGPNGLILRSDVPTFGEDLSTLARFSVGERERKSFVLSWYPSYGEIPQEIDAGIALNETENYWKKWSSCCTYKGEYREAVVRSLITLKGLTYAPTGGIMAALTTSLPEKLGGVRNWDYRFCWLRDALAEAPRIFERSPLRFTKEEESFHRPSGGSGRGAANKH